jgi:uncharacterized protein YyaL (SSP411 family)
MHRCAAIFIVMLVVPSLLRGDEPDATLWKNDVATAWETAKETDRPLLLYITMPNCLFCDMMKAKTFADAGVKSEIERGYVAVAMKHNERPKLIRHLRTRTYPTTVIIAPDGNVREQITGYVVAEKMKSRLRMASISETDDR